MTNTMNGERIEVLEYPGARPIIWLPYAIVPKVSELLNQHKVRYEVAEHVVSINDGPGTTFISLGWKENAAEVQAILDAAGE